MTARKRGGTQAANYVVHMPWEKTTICGLPLGAVHCFPDDDVKHAREEQCCRRCARGVLSPGSAYNAYKAAPK